MTTEEAKIRRLQQIELERMELEEKGSYEALEAMESERQNKGPILPTPVFIVGVILLAIFASTCSFASDEYPAPQEGAPGGEPVCYPDECEVA
jgi:hypothetical protein